MNKRLTIDQVCYLMEIGTIYINGGEHEGTKTLSDFISKEEKPKWDEHFPDEQEKVTAFWGAKLPLEIYNPLYA